MLRNNKGARELMKEPIVIVIAAVLFILIVSYVLGYRMQGYRIIKQGTLTIENLPAESEVYVDNALRGRFEGNTDIKLNPGLHDIIISKTGAWPYLEKISIGKSEPSNHPILKPFLISQNPDGKLIGTTEPEYLEAVSLFNKRAVPLVESKLLSPNGLVSIYVNDGKIFAVNEVEDGQPLPIFLGDPNYETLEVFDPVTEVRNLAFYKDRDDVLVIAIQDGVFVLELDPTVVQNLHPVIEGEAPDFRINEAGKFYAKDGNLLMLINL